MDVKTFDSILMFINTFKGLTRDCLRELQNVYPNISNNTLASILNTRYQKKMMINHGKVKRNRKNVMKRYKEGVEKKEEPGLIIKMAKQYDVAPALLAKVILEESFEKEGEKGEKDVSKTMIKDMFKDTNLIPDPDLAFEVYLSIIFDNMYGPISDVVKRSIGIEYEIKLCNLVKNAGLVYKTEEQLRVGGYDKTPDVKLVTPCAVDGFIITWVESKAIFGDQATHNQYMRDQYLSYWNRFGPGLVIYWFGFLETVPQQSEKRFIVRDTFPENVTTLNPSLIPVPKLQIR